MQTFAARYAATLLFGLGVLNFNAQSAGIYRELAKSFLAGKVYFVSPPDTGWMDRALFDGHYYCPFGALPALIAMPFVWLGYYHQGALNFFAALWVFVLCYRLATALEYSAADSWWLALAFCFGTSFVGQESRREKRNPQSGDWPAGHADSPKVRQKCARCAS